MRVSALLLSLSLLGLAVFPGCGSSGDLGVSTAGVLELDPNTSVPVSAGQVAIGETVDLPVTITNVGNGPLDVTGVMLQYASGDLDDLGPAFQLVELPEFPYTLDKASGTTGTRQLIVIVRYTRQAVFASRVATLIVTSSSTRTPTASVPVVEEAPAAVGSITKSIDFGTVEKGAVEERDLQVKNTGTETLVCDQFALRGHPDFTLRVGDAAYPPSESTLQRAALSEPILVEPNKLVNVKLNFAPTTESAAQGELVLFCNDLEGSTKGHLATLVANQNVPCITVTPKALEFGGKIVGQKAELPVKVCSCGSAPLKIKGISLDPARTAADYSMNYVGAGGGVGPTGIDPSAPLVLNLDDCLSVTVEYVPDVVNPLDADKRPIPDQGVVVVSNDSFENAIEVPVSGIGLEGTCPVPIITIEEGEQVVPQTFLHLDSNQSYSPNGSIIGREWSVLTGPAGNVSSFIPTASFEKPVYEVNVAGAYTFQLGVRDEANKRSGEDGCEYTTYTVLVIPDEAIHVELTWTTVLDTNDQDTGEKNGADMDLHFGHPFATGPQSVNPDIDGDGVGDPWFDTTFDSFWHDPNPNWGAFDPEANDDPSLDRDDIDGWGPENLNLDVPEEGATYHIGVHYWNDWGFGESLATVRVYIYGELDVEVKDVPMQQYDMWYVGTIPWAAGEGATVLMEKDGAKVITPKYLNPAFLPPIDAN
jgi:hypothetical protein